MDEDKWINNKYSSKWEKYKRFSTWNYRKVSKNNIPKYSAGILPYTYDLSGNCLFLLGKDTEEDWSDFGGRCEIKDNNDSILTASREFYEETLGSVLNIKECINKINLYDKKIISKTLNGSPYYMYIVYIDYLNYSEYFNKTSEFIKYSFNNEKTQINKFIEKINIKWVTIDTLLNCLENKNIKTNITLRSVFYKTLEICKEELIYLIR